MAGGTQGEMFRSLVTDHMGNNTVISTAKIM